MMLLNGEASHNAILNDRGLLYGDGVWETLVVRQGQALLLTWHLERLYKGLAKLYFNFNEYALLEAEIQLICQGVDAGVLKIIITRGQAQRGYVIPSAATSMRLLQISALPIYPAQYAEQGISLQLCQTRLAYQPLLAGFKHLNRLEQVLARSELTQDIQEGLVLDYNQAVIEGTISNIFVLQANGCWATPDLNACGIAGIMRRYLLQYFAEQAIDCEIKTLQLSDIQHAQALFFCNSLIGIWPVQRFNTYIYHIPPIVKHLQQIVKHVT
jgi:4-amino-4-deoxychorismate lyase